MDWPYKNPTFLTGVIICYNPLAKRNEPPSRVELLNSVLVMLLAKKHKASIQYAAFLLPSPVSQCFAPHPLLPCPSRKTTCWDPNNSAIFALNETGVAKRWQTLCTPGAISGNIEFSSDSCHVDNKKTEPHGTTYFQHLYPAPCWRAQAHYVRKRISISWHQRFRLSSFG